jgi:hypothetical protein
MTALESHVDPERLADYFALDLDPAQTAELEDHVFECSSCARSFERAGDLAAALRALIPPVISHEKLERLRRAGWTTKRVVVEPGNRIDAVFDRQLGLLIFALKAEPRDDERVDLEALSEDGQCFAELSGVPFDRGSGELLVACQRHYMDEYPPVIRFRAWAAGPESRRAIGEYVVNHILG